MHRGCNLHFELEVPTHMVCRKPSAKVVAEHLITARGKRILSSLQHGYQSLSSSPTQSYVLTLLNTFRLRENEILRGGVQSKDRGGKKKDRGGSEIVMKDNGAWVVGRIKQHIFSYFENNA